MRSLSVSYTPPPQLARPTTSPAAWLTSTCDDLLKPRRVSDRARLYWIVGAPFLCFLAIMSLRHTAVKPPAELSVTSSEAFEATVLEGARRFG